jgi:mRNA interferase HicA
MESAGCVFKRHGAKHDLYYNPKTNKQATVPRHTELADKTCDLICKELGIGRA